MRSNPNIMSTQAHEVIVKKLKSTITAQAERIKELEGFEKLAGGRLDSELSWITLRDKLIKERDQALERLKTCETANKALQEEHNEALQAEIDTARKLDECRDDLNNALEDCNEVYQRMEELEWCIGRAYDFGKDWNGDQFRAHIKMFISSDMKMREWCDYPPPLHQAHALLDEAQEITYWMIQKINWFQDQDQVISFDPRQYEDWLKRYKEVRGK